MNEINHGKYDTKQKTELTKGIIPRQLGHLCLLKTRRFPSPSCEGFGFIEIYLDTSTDIATCQFIPMGILRVCAIEAGLKINEVSKNGNFVRHREDRIQNDATNILH